MNTTVINRLLKTIETTADAKGWDVDSNRHYVAVTSIVVDVADFGKVPTYEEKVYVRDVLVALCMALDLNYEALLRQYVTEAEQNQWHYMGRVEACGVGFDEYVNTDKTLVKQVWNDGYEEIFEKA